MSSAVELAERGLVPDLLLRWGIRRLVRRRLRQEDKGSPETQRKELLEFIAGLRRSPVAVVPEKANEQHYEVPAAFFKTVLGGRLKYSGCYWPDAVASLDAAEVAMLKLTCNRAELRDGMDILELGCGWGSLCLWIAENYPASKVLAVSNSSSQRAFILERARELGLKNIEVQTADMNDFKTGRTFDRVVSVEMFEHMRNYETLLSRISDWLKPEGRLFVHIFTHRRFCYLFETEGDDNWMGRHFFTGGIMPSHDLLTHFQRDMRLVRRWELDGTHYRLTAEAWLKNLDARRAEVRSALAGSHGAQDADLWVQRWRMFFLATAELFGYDRGRQWQVSHYLFK